MKPTIKDTRHGKLMYYSSDDYVGKSLDYLGEYSQNEWKFYEQVIRPDMLVVDGGANIGAFTIPFAKAVQPKGIVIAFEPQKAIYQMLVGNLALNDALNVMVECACLGKEDGLIDFACVNYDVDGNFGGVAAGINPNGLYLEDGQDVNYFKVPVIALDNMKLPMLSVLKLDIEGMERDAIIGATQTIKAYHPLMYVENNNPHTSPALLETLFNLDYRCYWHISELDNKDNFFKYETPIFGNYANINMICVHKDRGMRIEGGQEILEVDAYKKQFPHHPMIKVDTVKTDY